MLDIIHWEELHVTGKLMVQRCNGQERCHCCRIKGNDPSCILPEATDAELEKFDNDRAGLIGEFRTDHEPEDGFKPWRLDTVARGKGTVTLEYRSDREHLSTTTFIWY